MKEAHMSQIVISDYPTEAERTSRRTLLATAGAAAIGVLGASLLAGCGGSSSLSPAASSAGSQDGAILNAAATAEALAVTMYNNIIHSSLYSSGLTGNAPDQAYLQAALEQELIHYNTLVAAGAKPLATSFYFPHGMFGSTNADYATTVNTLITLEDAFIAAYLIGINDFSTDPYKLLAGQIMGIECEHRALGRVIANDLGLGATTGLSGVSESTVPPNHAANNIAFERTFSAALPNIAAVVKALTPFVSASAAGYVAAPIPFSTSVTGTVTLDDTTPG
jgi:hypothetical protein